ERTSFYPTVRKTARAFGLEILPEAEPGAGYYYRSDHFSLARQGIPAFSIEEGSKYRGHPLEWGVKLHESYNRENYHQPGDEYRPQMDFTANAMMTRFGLALGWQAMEERTRISWNPGDEFEAARQRSLR
ncbi:MAG: M28 family peptidase, partial [Proteobacteria bacterium]|nr:M28 family peptidase [Pseudomonadota bacterium]